MVYESNSPSIQAAQGKITLTLIFNLTLSDFKKFSRWSQQTKRCGVEEVAKGGTEQ